MNTEPDELSFRRDVLLRFQVALLGMVEPHLRGVTVGWSATEIEATMFFDGRLGDDEEEVASDVEAELVASFPDHQVTVVAERLDPPETTPMREAWVYKRRE